MINKKKIGIALLFAIGVAVIVWVAIPFIFCVEKGEEVPSNGIFKFLELRCCENLTKRPNSKPASESMEEAGKAECMHPACECSICIPCGDDICDKEENHCNCPEDCKDE